MADVIPFQKRFSSGDFLKLIRKLSKDTSNIVLTDHSKEKMLVRKITFPQVLCCLR
ncbi:MAG: hypothetical protein KTR28_07260 [Micavibrio sp.]|nr:hypothetical protein [Micavibrio sp.]